MKNPCFPLALISQIGYTVFCKIAKTGGITLAQTRQRSAYAGGKRLQPAPKKKMRKKKHSFGIVLYTMLVIVSALIVTTYAGVTYFLKPPSIPETPSQSESSAITSEIPDSSGSTESVDPNALVRREGVYNFALLGKDVKGSNTDTIMIVSYDTKKQSVGMVSIPRDTAVERTWSSYKKINSAFFGSSPETFKEEIQHTFGIPVDYYVLVDLKGFIALVDELGGVDVYIPEDMDYDDPTPGEELHIHYTKGQHHLNGQQAMEVVRFRHNNDGSGYTDVGRSEMQRQVLLALAEKMISWNSITKIQSFMELFQNYIKTDLSTSDMLYFATQGMKLDLSSDVTQGTLPGRGDGVYGKSSWAYIFEAEEILPILNEQVNPYTRDLTEDDLNLPVAERYLQNY